MSAMEKDEEWKNELENFSIGASGKQTKTAPEGYFDQFPDRVMERWKQEGNRPVNAFIAWRRLMTAAAAVFGLSIGITLLSRQPPVTADPVGITSSEAYHYILENIDDFAPLMTEAGKQAEAIPDDDPGQTDPDILESKEIEEYLLEEMESEEFETLF